MHTGTFASVAGEKTKAWHCGDCNAYMWDGFTATGGMSCRKNKVETPCGICGGDGLVEGPINCKHEKNSSHSYCSHDKTIQHDN